MDCNDTRPLLSAYYDGEATPDERSRVERHLAGCEDCRRVLAEYRAIGGGMRALPVPVPPAGLRRDVWRAIEAQGAGRIAPGASARTGTVTNIGQKGRPRADVRPIRRIGGGWGRAILAMGLIAAVLVIFVGALIRTPAQAATLINDRPGYGEAIQVQFSQQVDGQTAREHTTLSLLQGAASTPVPDADLTKEYNPSTHVLTITSKKAWVAGATYQVDVDGPNISPGTVGSSLSKEPIKLIFSLPTFTPTSTNTPPPTATSMPTHTPEPTAIAQATDTPAPTSEATPPAPTAEATPPPTGTPVAEPTDTPVPISTATGTPTPVPEETATPTQTPPRRGTPTPHDTPTPTATNPGSGVPTQTPLRKGTPTATPHAGGTATPGCSSTPVSGFGKLWNQNATVRAGLGCPQAGEIAIQIAAEQHFQGGYMFWRDDTHDILVFLADGTWIPYADTWRDSDPTPAPSTPPSGYYEPVRGFGKIWHSSAYLRQHLGWAIDQERTITGAWQPFAKGSTLWTSDRYIRVLYDDGTWAGFQDTYVTPTPSNTNHPNE